ncbi:MAG: dienelactone hydrolase family protein [Rhodospirillaceae bacterium]|nr:dienelactone hydrolase family protein [Rhodospirillaceae bacterium]
MIDTGIRTLVAEDGHELTAYQALPEGEPKAGLVLIQEVFGVNHHIRAVADHFAGRGFAVIAPALFDRVERGIELGYGEADLARGRELRTTIGWQGPMMDTAAAMRAFDTSGKRVAVIGYCWGGSIAWLAATRLHPACTVCYYGGQIGDFKDEAPHCPVLMHFGERDHIITPDVVQAIRQAQPSVEIHVYPAGHGFNCTERPDFHAESAHQALDRTLTFFDTHLL